MYDVHTHFIPADVLFWIKENKDAINAQWEKKDPKKAEFLTVNGRWSFEVKEAFANDNLYANQQMKAGIAHSLISPIPQLFLYEFDKAITQELSAVYNNALAEMCQLKKDRFSALATVPLNDPEMAAGELRNAMSLGLKGAIIGPGLNGHMLTDDFFRPLWEEADRLGAILFIHPLLCEDPRLNRRMMPNLIGVPWETTICATDILLSGHLDKYPKVKVLLAHGGGLLPYQIGRIDKGYEMWKPVSANLQAHPREYLKKFWYDTVVWNNDTLQYLLTLVGEEQVVQGTDYPFDLCTWPPMNVGDKGFRSLMGRS